MAEVFLSTWQVAPEVVRPVVVKRLYSHFSDDERLVSMFIDEARLVCQLDHENIVKTYEIGLIEDNLCITMEYLEGQTLQQLLRRVAGSGGLPITVCVQIARGVLSALDYAHHATGHDGQANEIVHRDISPQNVFVTNAGQVKVLDFGIAKAKTNVQRTSTGVVKGKFAYIAPEQASAKSVDGRADLFSLGVVLWEMLASRRLFKADSDAATLEATLHREIPNLVTLRPDVPEALSAIVCRALQRDPQRRYSTAAEMLAELERFECDSGGDRDACNLSAIMQRCFSSEIELQRQLVRSVTGAHYMSSSLDTLLGGTSATLHRGSLPRMDTETQMLIARLRRSNKVGRGALFALGVLWIVVSWSWWQASRGTKQRDPLETPSTPTPTMAQGSSADDLTTLEPMASAASARASSATDNEAPTVPRDERSGSLTDKSRRKSVFRRAPAGSVSLTEPSHAALSPAAVTETGFLTIDTIPWSNVTWRGQALGQTPLVRAKLPIGSHVLLLRNPDLGIEASYTVTILANQTVVKRVGLQ